jgi:anti-sigma regulatory factor (Ser/Thr protein kinase)
VATDVVTMELPGDERFIAVAVAAAEALATRAGVNRKELARLRTAVHAVFVDHGSFDNDARVVLRYELGDGFLAVRVGNESDVSATS